MLSLSEIENYYPDNLRPFKRFILREYLQYKILEIVFESPWAGKLCFLGGTCLRIVHQQNRFSEDLDFDNFGLVSSEFEELARFIKMGLEKEGYLIETRNVTAAAFHCYIKFPNLLYNEGLTGHSNEKILIQVDAESQGFDFNPQTHILNKFDVFTTILTTPLDLLLAQKLYAILNRKRNKGRDFFDVIFLMGKGISPNYDYFNVKTNINDKKALKLAILNHCHSIDMHAMQHDVAPFLFDPNDSKKVGSFVTYFEQEF